jgi:hypothetical protein
MPPPIITSPPSQGAAIHPLLLGLFMISPSLVQAILSSNTSSGTLSHAVKTCFEQLKQGKNANANKVWELIGEDKLIPADAAELLTQICDLFDAELDLSARKSIGVETISEIIGLRDSSLVAKSSVQHAYVMPLTLPGVWTLEEVIQHNFKSEQVDYQFPNQDEPTDATKVSKFANVFHEGVIIHLQRYKFDFSLNQLGKVYDRVEFTDKCSGKMLGEFCISGVKSAMEGTSLELTAVVTHDDHVGYSLLVKSSDDGRFYKVFSHGLDNEQDDSPMKLEENSFNGLNEYFGGNVGDETAYLLFYSVKGGGNVTISSVMSSIRKSISKATGNNNNGGPPHPTPTTLAPATPVLDNNNNNKPTPPNNVGSSGGGCCVVQ